MSLPAPASSRPMELLPSRVAADGTRRRLLEVSLTLFAERGYHGVSVRDITGPLGIQPSALYAHAPSKQALLVELVQACHEEIRDSVRDALIASGPDPEDQLQAFMRAYVRFHTTYPLLATVGHGELRALGAEELRDSLALRREAVDLLQELLERGIEQGRFTCPDPWLVIAAIAGMGIRVASWYRPPGHPPSTTEDAYGSQVQSWFLPKQFAPEDVEDAYAELALKLVR